jgi:hypothetical protein
MGIDETLLQWEKERAEYWFQIWVASEYKDHTAWEIWQRWRWNWQIRQAFLRGKVK